MITAVISITSRMNIETKRDDKNCDVEVLLRRRRQKTVTKYLFFSIGDHMCGGLAGWRQNSLRAVPISEASRNCAKKSRKSVVTTPK